MDRFKGNTSVAKATNQHLLEAGITVDVAGIEVDPKGVLMTLSRH
jgi:hypothetical protein